MGAGTSKNAKAVITNIGSYACDGCKGRIVTVRYHHVDIANYDLCESCYKKLSGAHKKLYSRETEDPRVIVDRIRAVTKIDAAFRSVET
jgi:hypothetical protein